MSNLEGNKNANQHRGAVCSCLISFFIVFRRILDAVIDVIFDWYYSKIPVKKIAPVKSNLLTESAVNLAEKIRKKEVTSREVVQIFIDRIKEVNPILNAVVDDNFSRALEEADKVDEFIKSGSYTTEELKSYKPLLGVPFTSKESTAAEGMRWSFGIVSRKSVKADFDAAILKGLKDAGAILLGVTNVPEYNMWVESSNYVYGLTSNPYDTNRGVGGSSGGEACIVTACGSAFGLGTDIGGSSRIPACFCGVYGLKMTAGLINTNGMTFRTGSEGKNTIVTAGPICKHAADLKPITKAILAETPENITLLNLDLPVDAKKLRYFYVEEPGDLRVSPVNSEIKSALLKVVRSINEAGNFENSPEKVNFPGFKYSYTLWRYWMSKEVCDFAYDITNQQNKANIWTELPKKLLGLSNYTLAIVLRLIDLQFFPLPSAEWAETESERLRSDIINKLRDNGVLLFPSYPTKVPYHHLPYFRPYNFAYWAIFNALRIPSIQVPVGLSKDGLPLGIQVVAGPNQDRLCIAVAEEIEKLTGGWVAPFPEQA